MLKLQILLQLSNVGECVCINLFLPFSCFNVVTVICPSDFPLIRSNSCPTVHGLISLLLKLAPLSRQSLLISEAFIAHRLLEQYIVLRDSLFRAYAKSSSSRVTIERCREEGSISLVPATKIQWYFSLGLLQNIISVSNKRL